LHLTLKFLGEQPDSLVGPLAAAISTVAAQTRPIDLCIGAVGAFPTLRRPRTIYLTVTPDPKLELLHHDIEVTCASLGLPLAGRPFRPHVTIGREPEPPDLDARRALRAAARLVRLRATAPVPGIDLVESEQTDTGTRYRLAHHAPFRDG
jgi:2'-5' RNA ligase